jgi:hypothetical protein
MWRHRRLLGNPHYGVLGLFVIPSFLFTELLAPLIEAFGLLLLVVGLWLHAVDTRFAILFFLVAYGYGIVLSVATVLLETVTYERYSGAGDSARLWLWALFENLGYRQLTVWWRLHGMFRFLRGRKDWKTVPRGGFDLTPKALAKGAGLHG